MLKSIYQEMTTPKTLGKLTQNNVNYSLSPPKFESTIRKNLKT
jgi:hypothetical protein